MKYVGYIYITTNLINNKIYVGMHRVKNDQKDTTYFGSGKALKWAIEKYGIENFKNEIIEWCEDEDSLIEREIYWIDKLNAKNNDVGYNIKDGGVGGFNIDVSGKHNPMYGVHRYGEANPNYGNKRTEESKRQQSLTISKNGGHHGSNNPMYGKHHSEESKRKIVENRKTVKPLLGKTGKQHPCFGLKWWCDGVNPPVKSATRPSDKHHRGRK